MTVVVAMPVYFCWAVFKKKKEDYKILQRKEESEKKKDCRKKKKKYENWNRRSKKSYDSKN